MRVIVRTSVLATALCIHGLVIVGSITKERPIPNNTAVPLLLASILLAIAIEVWRS